MADSYEPIMQNIVGSDSLWQFIPSFRKTAKCLKLFTKLNMHPQRGAKEFSIVLKFVISGHFQIFAIGCFEWWRIQNWTNEIVLKLRNPDWIWLNCQSRLCNAQRSICPQLNMWKATGNNSALSQGRDLVETDSYSILE